MTNRLGQLCFIGVIVLALSVTSSNIAREISAPGDPIDYDVLDPIFMQNDFWGFNFNHSKDVLPYIRPYRAARKHINLRSTYLAYSFEDIDLVQGRPKMRDVFDIKRTERAPLVDKVLHDPPCSKL